jgi:hypothetical protein
MVTQKNTDKSKDAYHVIAVLSSDSVEEKQWKEEYEYIKSLSYVSIHEPSVISASSKQIVESNYLYFPSVRLQRDPVSQDDLHQYEQRVVVFTYLGDHRIRIKKNLFGNEGVIGNEMQLVNHTSYPEPLKVDVDYIAYGKFSGEELDYEGNDINGATFQAYNYESRYYIGDGNNYLDNKATENYIKTKSKPWLGIETYDKHSTYWEDNILRSLVLSNNSIVVISTSDAENIYDFHEGKAWLTQGDFFTSEDYEDGKLVCMIDYETARLNGLKKGDTFRLHFYISFTHGLYNRPEALIYSPSYPDYWGNDYGEADFIIKGIFTKETSNVLLEEEKNGILINKMILIPDQTMAALVGETTKREFQLNHIPSQLHFITLKVETSNVEQFLKEVSQLKYIKATIYDQGYSKVSKIIRQFDELARLVMVMATVCMIVLSAVFIFLEFMKRKTDVVVMNSLGCGIRSIRVYLILAIVMISVPSSILGSTGGFLLSGKIIEDIKTNELENKSSVLYAEMYGDSEIEEVSLDEQGEWITILMTVTAVNVITLLFGLIGGNLMIKLSTNITKSKKKTIKYLQITH